MKKTGLCLLLIAVTYLLNAQEKYDYTWLLGGDPNIPSEKQGGSKIDFNVEPPSISYFEIPFELKAISMMSNAEGQLQFYTNGCQIANANHQIMANGEGINPGLEHDIFCFNGYPRAQGALSLPWPGREGQYIILHTQFNQVNSEVHDLRYTTINMDTLDGLGSVIAKNQPLIVAEPLADMLTAVRHGNGRDWWIIMPRTLSNTHYVFLLNPQGIQGPFIQNFGEEWDHRYFRGHAVFSPDGTKYIRANPSNGLRITDFDRCTGVFSNPISISLLADSLNICGVAVSPNSRRLYLSAGFKLWQYDLEASDIALSRQLVGEYDGYQSPFNTTFYQPMLAPDGKIYITCTNGSDVLHIVHNPDAEGLACSFQQHGLTLPTYHAFMAPNFPHYRLYDVPGSVCDSLGINAPMVRTETPNPINQELMQVWPNPASGLLSIQLSIESAGEIQLFDVTGKQWLKQIKESGEALLNWNVGSIPSGIYFLSFQSKSGKQIIQKTVIQH